MKKIRLMQLRSIWARVKRVLFTEIAPGDIFGDDRPNRKKSSSDSFFDISGDHYSMMHGRD